MKIFTNLIFYYFYHGIKKQCFTKKSRLLHGLQPLPFVIYKKYIIEKVIIIICYLFMLQVSGRTLFEQLVKVDLGSSS